MPSQPLNEFINYVTKMRKAHRHYEQYPTEENFKKYLAYEKTVDYLLLKIDIINPRQPLPHPFYLHLNWSNGQEIWTDFLGAIYASAP